ncbi:MAG: response regulator [Candidatus Hydrogenedentes bacterium]|nr:response regulator [Candidatus Hydrogenedentota bacterium]
MRETKTYCVMLVDDEERALVALSRLLRKENYKLVTATSGPAALSLIAEQPVHVIVTDQQMPGMTGVELLKRVKAAYPDTIRMVLTGHAEANVALAAINEGEVYRFITKPVQGEELKLAIRHGLVQHDLLKDNKALIQEVQKQDSILDELEKEHPGISSKRVSKGAFVVEEIGLSLEEFILRYLPQDSTQLHK